MSGLLDDTKNGERWQIPVSHRVLLAMCLGFAIGPCVGLALVAPSQNVPGLLGPTYSTTESILVLSGAPIVALVCGTLAWGPWKPRAMPASVLGRSLVRHVKDLGLALACFGAPAIVTGAIIVAVIRALAPEPSDSASELNALALRVLLSLGGSCVAGCGGLAYYFHRWYRG